MDAAVCALSRPVTEEMVERGWRGWGDFIEEPMDDVGTANIKAEKECVRAILTAALGTPAAAERVRHRKRGTTYTVVGSANIQTDTPITDNAAVIVYRSEHDGTLWVRPVSEFHDGRFEVLTAGHETYPGHDPAAGLPQPPTEKGGDANSDGSLDHGPDNAQPRSPDTAGGAVSLEECPIGLFVPVAYPEELCLKTEYGNNEGRIDAFIVSSGEFFWGEAPQTIANQRKQMVIPFDMADREASIRAEATAKERERCAGVVDRWAKHLAPQTITGPAKSALLQAVIEELKAIAAAIRGGSHD